MKMTGKSSGRKKVLSKGTENPASGSESSDGIHEAVQLKWVCCSLKFHMDSKSPGLRL